LLSKESAIFLSITQVTKGRPFMARMTIRLPDDQHHRLKSLATQRGMSLNKLIEELSISALAGFDAENRFHLRAARGDVAAGLAVLDKAEAFFNNPA
jgi:hypothetical protein